MRTIISLARRASFGECSFKLLGVCFVFALLCLGLEFLPDGAVLVVVAAAAA